MASRDNTSAPDPWCDESPESVLKECRVGSKPILLGLPCARCRLYYDSQLKTCPRCGCGERESAHEFVAPFHRAA